MSQEKGAKQQTCLKSSLAEGRPVDREESPWCVIVLLPVTTVDSSTWLTLQPWAPSWLEAKHPSTLENVTYSDIKIIIFAENCSG